MQDPGWQGIPSRSSIDLRQCGKAAAHCGIPRRLRKHIASKIRFQFRNRRCFDLVCPCTFTAPCSGVYIYFGKGTYDMDRGIHGCNRTDAGGDACGRWKTQCLDPALFLGGIQHSTEAYGYFEPKPVPRFFRTLSLCDLRCGSNPCFAARWKSVEKCESMCALWCKKQVWGHILCLLWEASFESVGLEMLLRSEKHGGLLH